MDPGDEILVNGDVDNSPPWLVYGDGQGDVHGDVELNGSAVCKVEDNGAGGGDYHCQK